MTDNDLRAVLTAVGVTSSRAAAWAGPLSKAFAIADITTPLRVGHFLAQLLHESAALKYKQEIWGPTSAQRRYEGRRDLGNVVAGDGYRFRGRGPIQLTGRANYAQFNSWLSERGIAADVVNNPDLVATYEYGSLAACFFWATRNLNRIADRGDDVDEVTAITRVVNGGRNGLADRIRWFVQVMMAVRKIPSYRGDALPL